MKNTNHNPEKVILDQNLKKCTVCSRHFTAERINAHEAICQASSGITRKRFDISEQIMRGSDAEKIVKEDENEDCRNGAQKSARSGLNTNWRGKHEEFLRKVKEAKQEFLGKKQIEEELPQSSYMCQDFESVQCQYCLRHYSKPSAPRHISICAWRNSKAAH